MCAKDKMEDKFKLTALFGLSGDQPQAVEKLVRGFLEKDGTHQTLLGVTGSGKTFTMANVIARLNRPTLVLAHNKTLAAQLYSEFKEFFPENSVNYFVSYYDYYQPEAYIPASDVYIEKDASVNERIEKLRLMTTKALLERRDVVVVASVSCIYGLGKRKNYEDAIFRFACGERWERRDFMMKLLANYYERNDMTLVPGTFRSRGETMGDIPVVQRHCAAHILLRRRDRTHRRDRPCQRQQRRAQGESRHLPVEALHHEPRRDKERRGRDRKRDGGLLRALHERRQIS